jgi:predicted RNA methylase
MEDLTRHWENAYATHNAHEVSWYQIRPDTSLQLIGKLGIGADDAVIDIGGGASSLVDHLLALGFRDLAVLDISSAALAAVQARLGRRAQEVKWLTGDITRRPPQGPFRLWHDRAVFHFLTEAADRAAYQAALEAALPGGSFAIIATFAEDGPERCSNLPVRRYSPEQLAAELGPGFTLVEALRETHVTPAQGEQKFIYCVFRRA